MGPRFIVVTLTLESGRPLFWAQSASRMETKSAVTRIEVFTPLPSSRVSSVPVCAAFRRC